MQKKKMAQKTRMSFNNSPKPVRKNNLCQKQSL